MKTSATRLPRPSALPNRRSTDITANPLLERALQQLEHAFRIPLEGSSTTFAPQQVVSRPPEISDVASFVLLNDAEQCSADATTARRDEVRRMRATIAQQYRLTEFEGLFTRSEIDLLRAFIAGRSDEHIPVVHNLIVDLPDVRAERLIANIELASYETIDSSVVPQAADRRLLTTAGIDNLALLACVRLQEVVSAAGERPEALWRLRVAVENVAQTYAIDCVADSVPIASITSLRAWLAGARSDVALLSGAVPAINRTVRDVSVIGALDAMLSTLTDRERAVLELRFGLLTGARPSLRKVGRCLGVSGAAVCQIERKAIIKLNAPPRRQLVLRAVANVVVCNANSPTVPLRQSDLHAQMVVCGVSSAQAAGATELVAAMGIDVGTPVQGVA